MGTFFASFLGNKKKTERSNSTEQTNDATIDQSKNTITLRNSRKKESSVIDKKHSRMYIEKNLSYSPSMISNIGKNSHTPSLLIRNNQNNIENLSPYNYSNKSRNMYNKYTGVSSNTSVGNKALKEEEYLNYSPYKKYLVKRKDQVGHWKIDRK